MCSLSSIFHALSRRDRHPFGGDRRLRSLDVVSRTPVPSLEFFQSSASGYWEERPLEAEGRASPIESLHHPNDGGARSFSWIIGREECVVSYYIHTHTHIYIYIWASHRAYFFARSCAEQRIQNRVLYPRRFLTNGASISMVVIYHNVLFARPADARIFARSSDFIFERFRVVDLPATSARPIPVGRSCRISASLEPSIKSTWSTKVLKNI